MQTEKYFSSVKIKFGNIFTSDIFQNEFYLNRKKSIQINFSKAERNSEF